MGTANIETIQRVYEAFGRGDVGAILDNVTDDVDWASECSPGVAPWHGIRHGKGEVQGFFEALGATAEIVSSPRSPSPPTTPTSWSSSTSR